VHRERKTVLLSTSNSPWSGLCDRSIFKLRLFLPKVLAGFMSGYLLEQYCTAEDCADPRPLWGWIMAACIPFPVALYLL